MNPLQFGRSICGDFERAAEHEWLVTNGIGGFASGTMAEANTRRYHGLLIAALEPPVARMLLVAKIDAIATYRGEPFPLSSNEFRGGTVAPHGYRHLDSFYLDTVVVSAEPEAPAGLPAVKKALDDYRATLIEILPTNAPPWIRQLALAADQFIVQRRLPAGGTGRSVIAGYPWFTDWGRDTMIALTGLTLVPRRFDVAAEILRTFGAHLSEGMLPNRFPDDGASPEYNSVDAALWYIHALQQYTLRIGDRRLATELYPVVCEIIDCYRQGTRHGIHVDPADGLLSAGGDGVQLTWMDAKVGDHVVIPRSGKAVEVNALWYNALKIGRCFAELLGDAALAQSFLEPFGRHLASHGLGTISGIFDADPPHAPHGCFAQAWSVAEVLRAGCDLNDPVSLVNPR